MTARRCLLFEGEQCRTHKSRYQVPIAELAERWTELPQVSDESRSFFRVHTGYFSNIPKCIKAEFIASWACSQSSVVSSSKPKCFCGSVSLKDWYTIKVCHEAYKSLVVRASDSRPEGLGSMLDVNTLECTRSTCSLNQWVRSLVGLTTSARTGEYFPPLQFTCRNCGGGGRGRVAIYRPFGEFHRAKITLSPVRCSRPTTGVPLPHATMNFVDLDLTTSDRWH
ncbi:hypothetical protein TNCV_2448821 [Trichonephila clavipes]|uniref:Uncharacterized protein n=1 Tax=Trichonephila clavipes TaxID=2585209 RepID=A0A8X6SI90_TRICX|nr:hypothetical protein TNCV_2448821 [Trichonephila clavipes]